LKIWLRNTLTKIVYFVLPKIGRASRELSPERVVLINLENIGDFILFSSVIREVRANFPDSQLVVVGQKENSGLVKHCQIVDEWIWVRSHKAPKLGESIGQEIKYQRKMLSVYFKLCVKFRGKIDLLIGPDWLLTKDANQFVKNFLYKKANVKGGYAQRELKIQTFKYIPNAHQVPRMLSILEMLGLRVFNLGPQSWILPPNSNPGLARTGELSGSKLKIVICLGAGHFRRNWPAKAFRKVIIAVKSVRPEIEFLIIGPRTLISPELCESFAGLDGTQELIGKTDFPLAAKLISDATLVIVNDSGFAHLAASLHIPTLVLSAHPMDADPWHLHSPNRYHPWGNEYIELQPSRLLSPCVGSCGAPEPHCIGTIEPEEVASATLSLLEKINRM
jgi:heptosyltransferase-2